MAVRMTEGTRLVLRALLGEHPEPMYGGQLVALTSLPTGMVHPMLYRLYEGGLVERCWEDSAVAEADGRPRRRLYWLTGAGVEAARGALEG